MPRTGTPTKIAPGIFRYDTFIRVVAKVGKTPRETRFPLDASEKAMVRWQLKTKADLLAETPTTAKRGTLIADVPRYLATLNGRRRKDDRALLQHWTASPVGNLDRSVITRTQVRAQLARWEDAGVAASTINHRLRALRNVYKELDGEDEDNPTDKVKKLREPEPQARGRSYDLLEAILAFLPDRGRAKKGEKRNGVSLGKRRAEVMAWTGLPPSLVMKILPVHFNQQAATLKAQPRRKGKGVPAETLPLLPQAVNALVRFFAAKAQGRFSTSAFYKQWNRAQRELERSLRAQVADAGGDPSTVVLPRVRPYDLRHSFLTEIYRRSRDPKAVKKLGMHSRFSTSERYIEGAVDEAAQRAIDSWKATG